MELINYFKKLTATTLLILFKYSDNSSGGKILKSKIILSDFESNTIDKLRKDGLVIIEDFYSRNQCEVIIDDINKHIKIGHPKMFIDSKSSDHRINGMEYLSENVNKFISDDFLDKISKVYSNKEFLHKFCMGAKLKYKAENLGSGGGWHRDSLGFQYKAMLYLSDVDENSGPFEYFIGSHKSFFKFKNYILDFANGFKDIVRYSDSKVDILKNKNKITCNAKAGTLILFNSSGLHRGKPIKKGVRYALTNYYSNLPWTKNWYNQLITEKEI